MIDQTKFIYQRPSNVYFTKEITSDAVLKLYDRIKLQNPGKIAIKLHFGEKGNKNFAAPELSKALALRTDATLVDSNVLYVGPRRYTDSHIALAKEHGFDFAPICILDGDEEIEIPVQGTKYYDKIRVGSHFKDFDSYIVFSHCTGHVMAGFGAAVKNVAMGMAAVGGKMQQHSSSIPLIDGDKCISCGECIDGCAQNAISIDPVVIDPDKCVGCGKCIGICPQQVYDVNWGSTQSSLFVERMVEYAKGMLDDKPMVFITVLANISPDCDCDGHAREPFVDDIGIIASTDIVAIDKAAFDLVARKTKKENVFTELHRNTDGRPQYLYGNQIGLGNMDYKLIELD
ncbi:MAG: DUF362 domain-containing protein [Bacteroidales bacterium]|nr:DUF362 domain-containing protein [Bacteroidales bacterium]